MGKAFVVPSGGRDGEARLDVLLLFQRPGSDDGVDQLFGLGGEGLSQQVSESLDLDDSQLRERFSASDVFSDRRALLLKQNRQ